MFRRPAPATVISLVALVFSVSGVAVAAKPYVLDSTSQINPKVLKALKGKKGPKGARGAQGAAGAPRRSRRRWSAWCHGCAGSVSGCVSERQDSSRRLGSCRRGNGRSREFDLVRVAPGAAAERRARRIDRSGSLRVFWHRRPPRCESGQSLYLRRLLDKRHQFRHFQPRKRDEQRLRTPGNRRLLPRHWSRRAVRADRNLRAHRAVARAALGRARIRTRPAGSGRGSPPEPL